MNIETAQDIIEQEALLMLIANSNLEFDINDGYALWQLFNNSSQVVSNHDKHWIDEHECMHHIFKIDHPDYDIIYYEIYAGSDIYDKSINVY